MRLLPKSISRRNISLWAGTEGRSCVYQDNLPAPGLVTKRSSGGNGNRFAFWRGAVAYRLSFSGRNGGGRLAAREPLQAAAMALLASFCLRLCAYIAGAQNIFCCAIKCDCWRCRSLAGEHVSNNLLAFARGAQPPFQAPTSCAIFIRYFHVPPKNFRLFSICMAWPFTLHISTSRVIFSCCDRTSGCCTCLCLQLSAASPLFAVLRF